MSYQGQRPWGDNHTARTSSWTRPKSRVLLLGRQALAMCQRCTAAQLCVQHSPLIHDVSQFHHAHGKWEAETRHIRTPMFRSPSLSPPARVLVVFFFQRDGLHSSFFIFSLSVFGNLFTCSIIGRTAFEYKSSLAFSPACLFFSFTKPDTFFTVPVPSS